MAGDMILGLVLGPSNRRDGDLVRIHSLSVNTTQRFRGLDLDPSPSRIQGPSAPGR